MTKHDLRIAMILVAVVAFVGVALGYGVGYLTRGNTPSDVAKLVTDNPKFPAPANQLFDADNGVQLPGYQELYVNDYQDLLDDDASTRIRQNLIDLYQRTGVQMTVLTISHMNAYGHDGPIEPFATQIFNAWGVGHATRNDGVMILIARFDRKMRIEIGSGYAKSWDARMQRVIDDAFLPEFRNDNYQAGIEKGVEATILEITGVYPGDYDAGTFDRGWSRISRWFKDIGAWAFGVVGAPLAGFAFWVRRYLRNRPRPCAKCKTLMIRAGEQADDEHLEGGQKLEEFLKSVDYDVWHCPDCAHMDIIRYKNWFSSLGACPRCKYRTMSTDTTVLHSATTSSTGSKRIDYSCAQCKYENSEIRTIPKRSKSSSSSGSSSFGGGSSSGGGASGSW